ncbi:hypothetical protein KJ654_00240 [Patescibacteria group bacterium]|nr:hypothetical protein [Patescibacteria group bacterium]MBU1966789.1 hypothetical protein [Patescibacteria group bacterium]
MEKNNQGSFTTGFTLGIFAGVAGYYLFGTKQGEKTRKRLVAEWEQAHQHLVDQGIVSTKTEYKNLGEFLQIAKNEFLKQLDIELDDDRVVNKKRSYTRQTKQKQFRGV